MSDHPFGEIVASAKKLHAQGAQTFQKFTCSGCGQRLTIDEPNVFYTTGSCDKCDVVTDIEKQGCNYLLVMPLTDEGRETMVARSAAMNKRAKSL